MKRFSTDDKETDKIKIRSVGAEIYQVQSSMTYFRRRKTRMYIALNLTILLQLSK